jgi:DNA-directed RNA polymerase subunit RPC12/RpoP
MTAAAHVYGLCRVLGHELDNRLVADDGPNCSRCQQRFLFEDGRITHTRHVLGCMRRHHTYQRIDRRAAHNEYACLRCAQPLLLAVDRDPHRNALPFPKRLQLLCGTFGHSVHRVTARDGLTEYACGCGHSFLLAQEGLTHIAHPLVCRMSGHRVTFVQRRGSYQEHRCLDCGHPFLYKG